MSMTKEDAIRAARALLDGMAGTTEGEWTCSEDEDGLLLVEVETAIVAQNLWTDDAAHIARSCPARLGPVLRALMEGEE